MRKPRALTYARALARLHELEQGVDDLRADMQPLAEGTVGALTTAYADVVMDLGAVAYQLATLAYHLEQASGNQE